MPLQSSIDKVVYPLRDQRLAMACDGLNWVIEMMHRTVGECLSVCDLGLYLS